MNFDEHYARFWAHCDRLRPPKGVLTTFASVTKSIFFVDTLFKMWTKNQNWNYGQVLLKFNEVQSSTDMFIDMEALNGIVRGYQIVVVRV